MQRLQQPHDTNGIAKADTLSCLSESEDPFGEIEDQLRRGEAHDPPYSREPFIGALRLARREYPEARRAAAAIYRERAWWSYWRRQAA